MYLSNWVGIDYIIHFDDVVTSSIDNLSVTKDELICLLPSNIDEQVVHFYHQKINSAIMTKWSYWIMCLTTGVDYTEVIDSISMFLATDVDTYEFDARFFSLFIKTNSSAFATLIKNTNMEHYPNSSILQNVIPEHFTNSDLGKLMIDKFKIETDRLREVLTGYEENCTFDEYIVKCDYDNIVTLKYHDYQCKLTKSAYDKLQNLYIGPEDYFDTLVWALTFSYDALYGNHMNLFTDTHSAINMHSATNPNYIDSLGDDVTELYASPFNTHTGKYCSALPFIDKFFGSLGRAWVDYTPTSGTYLVNPPYVETILIDNVNKIKDLCSFNLHPTKFVLIGPGWSNPISPYMSLSIMSNSSSCYVEDYLWTDSGIQFINGNSHKIKDDTHIDSNIVSKYKWTFRRGVYLAIYKTQQWRDTEPHVAIALSQRVSVKQRTIGKLLSS